MAPPLVIFDFDGTIADSRFAIGRTAQIVLERMGVEPIEEEQFHARIGLPLERIFSEVVPTLDPGQLEVAVASYRAAYAEVSSAHTTVFEGMRELLEGLRDEGTMLAIATGKSTKGAHRAIERLQLDAALFRCVVGNDAVPRPKPDGDMVDHILEELGVAATETRVVGDTSFDVQMSVSAGVACCGVTWGSHTRETLVDAGATWVVDTPKELAAVLAG